MTMMMTRTQRRSRVVRRNTREFSLLWWWWCRAFFVSVRRARERKHKDDDDDDVFVLFFFVVVVVSYKVFWVRTKTTNTNGICVGMSDPKKKREGHKRTHEISTSFKGAYGIREYVGAREKGTSENTKYVESKSVLKNTTTSTRAWFFYYG